MSTTKRTPRVEFEFVYDSKRPTSLHALVDGRECWAGHMRPATPEELKRLRPEPICKHCAARVARQATQVEEHTAPKPKTSSSRRKPTKPKPDAGDTVVLVGGVKVAETRQVTM